jgi:hypothetical protein
MHPEDKGVGLIWPGYRAMEGFLEEALGWIS